MVMNVLWTRLGETGKDWRYVYKALAVIEYLVGNGSERAVDDIIEHTFQISALASFEYVEPSGKDVGLNVRKKAETIVSLLNDRDKIHDVRNKASANRDKYIGVSSSGITYKSGGSASYSSGGFSQSSGKYGGFGSRDGDRFSDSNRDKGGSYDDHGKSNHTVASDNQDNSFKKGSSRSVSKSPENKSSRVSKSSTNANNYGSVPSQSSSVPGNSTEDDMDDFDPRGTSTKTSPGNSNQVDLFGQDLIGDFMDAPTSVPVEKPATGNLPEVDLFADASFVSATPQMDKGASSQPQAEVDLFASQPAISTVTPTADLFSIAEPVVQPDSKPEKSGPVDNSSFDPFAAVPLNNFDGSDIFGDFTSQSDSVSSQPSNNVVRDDKHDNITGKTLADTKVPSKKDTFQVKSGVWADSLSRGLIDLNITAPKKVSLADVGIVGDLSDGSEGKEKGPPPSFYMGRAMGSGLGSGSGSIGLGRSGFTPSQPAPADDIFSSLGSQQYQFGAFQK